MAIGPGGALVSQCAKVAGARVVDVREPGAPVQLLRDLDQLAQAVVLVGPAVGHPVSPPHLQGLLQPVDVVVVLYLKP